MSFWEMLFWSVLGLYFGFMVFDLVPYKVDYWLYLSAAVLIPGIIPIVVGGAIYKSHVNVGTADASLKALPLKPVQVIGSRMLAVALSSLQYLIPLILILILAQEELLSIPHQRNLAAHDLYGDKFLDGVTFNLYIHGQLGKVFLLEPIHRHNDVSLLLYLLGFIQIIGWVTFPLTWGFLWASYFQRRGGLFLLAYIAYFIIPGLIFMIMFEEQQYLFGHFFTEFWVQAYAIGLGGVLISIVLFFLALRTWGRRTG